MAVVERSVMRSVGPLVPRGDAGRRRLPELVVRRRARVVVHRTVEVNPGLHPWETCHPPHARGDGRMRREHTPCGAPREHAAVPTDPAVTATLPPIPADAATSDPYVALLPHRPPFRFVDAVDACSPGVSIAARY